MSKEQMRIARNLIRQGEFDKARRILKRTDHPKSDEWLAKLDKIAPPKSGYVAISMALFVVAMMTLGCGIMLWLSLMSYPGPPSEYYFTATVLLIGVALLVGAYAARKAR